MPGSAYPDQSSGDRGRFSAPSRGLTLCANHAGWIPLWSDPTGADFIGVDLAPGEKGQVGQIINFGRDEEEHRCYAPRFEDLLQILLDEVESGAWPASERTGSNGAKQPWLGDPQEHFFNTLYARWKARMPPDPRELVQNAKAAIKAREYQRAGELLAQARSLGMVARSSLRRPARVSS